jgi:ATP-dependent exoDNAse (exonuclease V) beta subunit
LPKGKPTILSRLAYQIPRFLKENSAQLLETFPDCKIESEENEDFIFKFQMGERKFDGGKKVKKEEEELISPCFSKVKEMQWLPKEQKENAWFGTAFHKIVEKTKIYTNWGADFEKVTNKGDFNNTQSEELKAQIHRFFENENIKNWFSDKYESFPELEFVSRDGTILRADRVLKKEEGFVVLDFKTGEKSSIHFDQLKNYKNHLQNFSNQEVKAFVVYSGDQIEIEELTD